MKRKRYGGTATILGLIIGTIGLIPVFRAGPTVVLGTPLDPDNVLTTPVEITNGGFFDLKDVSVQSFEILATAGDFTSGGNIVSRYTPPNKILQSEQSETVPLQAFGIGMPRDSEVIALLAFYRVGWVPFISRRIAFRFEAVRQSDGRLRLVKQPPGNTFEQYDALIRFQEKQGVPSQ